MFLLFAARVKVHGSVGLDRQFASVAMGRWLETNADADEAVARARNREERAMMRSMDDSNYGRLEAVLLPALPMSTTKHEVVRG